MSDTTYELTPPPRPRGRGDPHDPRGGRRVRASRAAVLRGQGLDRDAPPGREGVRAGAGAVPGDARRHRPQLRRGASPSATGWSSELGRPPRGRQRAGRHRRGPGRRGHRSPGQPQPPPDRSRCSAASRSTRFDAVFGGARRDEEKARAKERVFSFRDEFGQWDPKNQRPELWSLYNGTPQAGRAHPRVPAVELDRARHLAVHRRGGASTSRRSTSPTPARCSCATACGWTTPR